MVVQGCALNQDSKLVITNVPYLYSSDEFGCIWEYPIDPPLYHQGEMTEYFAPWLKLKILPVKDGCWTEMSETMFFADVKPAYYLSGNKVLAYKSLPRDVSEASLKAIEVYYAEQEARWYDTDTLPLIYEPQEFIEYMPYEKEIMIDEFIREQGLDRLSLEALESSFFVGRDMFMIWAGDSIFLLKEGYPYYYRYRWHFGGWGGHLSVYGKFFPFYEWEG